VFVKNDKDRSSMKNLGFCSVRGLDFGWDVYFSDLNEVSLFDFARNSRFNFFGIGGLILS